MTQEHLFQGTGWGAVAPDLAAIPVTYAAKTYEDAEDEHSGASSPVGGAAPPPDLIAAFLQTHTQQQEPEPSGPSVLRSSASVNSDIDGEQPLHNPFASVTLDQHHQVHPQPPAAPSVQQQQKQKQRHPSSNALESKQQQVEGHQSRLRSKKPKRSLLRRLLRGLMVTGASTALLALGAWGGSLAYKHYMVQLDDRDQLARRVAELLKQEEKLVLRCTAIEQERSNLKDQLSRSNGLLSEGEAARSKLKQQLNQAAADRDEAVKLNLNLQRKLTSLEEQHTVLTATHKETVQALDMTLAEAAQLHKEGSKLMASVEKLESRCGALETANVELKRENAALGSAVEQHKCKADKARAAH